MSRKLKLSDEQVLEIRIAMKDDLERAQEHQKYNYTRYRGLSNGILARRYGVSEPTIENVLKRRGAYARKPHIRADKLHEF